LRRDLRGRSKTNGAETRPSTETMQANPRQQARTRRTHPRQQARTRRTNPRQQRGSDNRLGQAPAVGTPDGRSFPAHHAPRALERNKRPAGHGGRGNEGADGRLRARSAQSDHHAGAGVASGGRRCPAAHAPRPPTHVKVSRGAWGARTHGGRGAAHGVPTDVRHPLPP
jgi:hypothetical protein